jgi:hypothetical protein
VMGVTVTVPQGTAYAPCKGGASPTASALCEPGASAKDAQGNDISSLVSGW